MSCNVFLEAFEKNFDIELTVDEKEQFCRWAEEQVGRGEFNVRSLLSDSPEGISSKLSDIDMLRESERLAIHDALEILVDVYLGSSLLD
jgi:hypothetical protein